MCDQRETPHNFSECRHRSLKILFLVPYSSVKLVEGAYLLDKNENRRGDLSGPISASDEQRIRA